MELVRKFEQLWNSATAPPDVFSFLRLQGASDSDHVLAVLLTDQQRRWLTDKPLRVEDYLAGLPDLPANVDWKLQLAIGEFEGRRNTARPLSFHEISSRFPDLSDTLRERLRQQMPDAIHRSAQMGPSYGGQASGLLQTVIKAQTGPSSTVTYITNNAIGVQQKGRYRLDRVLGEGAFGRVYLGFDEELQRQVAIKVPTKARFQKPEDADDYLAEARTVASLDHPHIVPVYDMGRTEDGSIYVVSKYIEGGTLEDRIKERASNDLRSRSRETSVGTILVAGFVRIRTRADKTEVSRLRLQDSRTHWRLCDVVRAKKSSSSSISSNSGCIRTERNRMPNWSRPCGNATAADCRRLSWCATTFRLRLPG